MSEEKFLIDSSSFITPFRLYYAVDLIPSYWDRLAKCLGTGRIILLDMVKAELEKGDDELTDWIHNNENMFTVCSLISSDIIDQYQKVLQHIQTCGYYRESALDAWAQDDSADPWLVAAAAARGFTIITNEASAGTLSTKTPSRIAKIPDVARHFGVNSQSLYYMMRELGIKI